MLKQDFKKIHKELYAAKASMSAVVKVPAMQYLAISGQGDPNTSLEYKAAIETLYPVAYKIKFTVKKKLNKDYCVMPLEGLWWMKDMKQFSIANKADWLWTALIMQPDYITPEIFQTALAEVKSKKEPPALNKIKLITLNEGSAAQIMHVGPYSTEKATIEKMHHFIKEAGHKFNGRVQKHHEIYLGDPRKTAPEKLKTIIRQPFVD
ncbi:MAG: hypothetical protein ACD_72C00328G0008 [uncultured bacterium]|nr:MAG: hypothetical protein ACD_72C00328G0008 [uncultured bacterium]